MYKKKKFNNKKPQSKSYMDNTHYDYTGRPGPEGTIRDSISFKALRDLPHSSYSVKVDPYTASLPTSNPYPLLNRFNRLVDCKYQGEDNIDGGNVQQYANSMTSKYLKCFDAMRMFFKVNYRYLPIVKNSDGIGYNLVDEMRRSIAETVSMLQSSTYHTMAINSFAVATDMNLGGANKDVTDPNVETITIDNVKYPVYRNQTDVLYSMAIYYQVFLQEALAVMNTHNAFRLKQGTMIRNAWNREVPSLNGFFGLMNKKAFLSMLESINLSFEGEYIDKEWMIETNAITTIPSRRGNDMFDPIKELQVSYNHPSVFRVYVVDDQGNLSATPLFDDAQLVYSYTDAQLQVITESYWTMAQKLKAYLSLEHTTKWARDIYLSPLSATSENARYNLIKTWFDGINHCFTIFKPLWSDFREVMDTMQRTGAVGWTKGFRPGITKDTDAPIFDNKIVDDIYNLVFSGPASIDFSNITKRFRTWSLWNMYSGIASYDIQSGGSFLTFSFKTFAGTDSDNVWKYVPRLFDLATANIYCTAVARDGVEVQVAYNTVTLNNVRETKRLVPLTSQSSITARIATINALQGNTITDDHYSLLIKLLTQEFGMCQVTISNDTNTYVDPDIFAIYQIELNDVSNEAITYARANAPYRGTTSQKSILGMVPALHK